MHERFGSMSELLQAAAEAGIRPTHEEVTEVYRRLGAFDGSFIAPAPLARFVSNLVDRSSVRTVLDPFAGIGSLLAPFASSPDIKCVAVNPRLDLSEGVSSWLGHHVECHTGRVAEIVAALGHTFDLVVCLPPWNLPQEAVTIGNGGEALEVRDSASHTLLLHAASKVRAGGHLVFVVPASFFSQDEASVRANLSAVGLELVAALAVSDRTFRPHTILTSYVVVIRKAITDNDFIFVGEYLDDRDRQEALVTNLRNNSAGETVALGRFVRSESFSSYGELLLRQQFEALATTAQVPIVRLGDVAVSVRMQRRGEAFEAGASDAVFVASIGTPDASTDPSRVTANEAAQLVFDPAKAHAEYVAAYLNTEAGRIARRIVQRGATIPRVTKEGWTNVPLLLPPLDEQVRIIRTVSRLRTVKHQLEEIETRLWREPSAVVALESELDAVNRGQGFADWVATLPFPLASILWTYGAAGKDEKRRYEHLLHFFEAYAEFVATILLSAYRDDSDTVAELRRILNKARQSIERASFGTWVTIAQFLGKLTRKSLSADDHERESCERRFATADHRVIRMFACQEGIEILQKANTLRNLSVGHGGIVSDDVARSRHADLELLLTTLRGVFGTSWRDYRLIRPGLCRTVRGSFIYEAQALVGPTTPFASTEIRLSEPMEEGVLHFADRNSTRALRLLGFVRLGASPVGQKNACYFYNRTDKSGVRLVSYHFEEEAEIRGDFPDVANILEQLRDEPTR